MMHTLPQDVVKHLSEPSTSKCADGRKTWDCHWCGMPTPVGWGRCRDNFECMRRIVDQRDRAIDFADSLIIRLRDYD